MILDVVLYNDRVGLRMYRSEFNSIPDHKQQDMVEWMRTLLETINSKYDFVVTIEMEEEPREV